MITKKGSSPVMNCSEGVISMREEPRSSRKLVLVLSAFRLQEHPYTHKEPLLRMIGNGKSFSSNGGYAAVAVSVMVIKMLRRYEQEERQTGNFKDVRFYTILNFGLFGPPS